MKNVRWLSLAALALVLAGCSSSPTSKVPTNSSAREIAALISGCADVSDIDSYAGASGTDKTVPVETSASCTLSGLDLSIDATGAPGDEKGSVELVRSTGRESYVLLGPTWSVYSFAGTAHNQQRVLTAAQAALGGELVHIPEK